ncbi:hypothetical protein [Saccharopolyspora taberi]
MASEAVHEQHRVVPVEFGHFYFGDWPSNPHYAIPVDNPGLDAVCTEAGIAFFSQCDEGESALVSLYFFDARPEDADLGGATRGELEISGQQVTTATTDMLPIGPFAPPFTGRAEVRIWRSDGPASGEVQAAEEWRVYLWPARGHGERH